VSRKPRVPARVRLASALLVAVLGFAPGAARADVVNRIILRVNDQIATLHDYQQRKRELVQEITRREQDAQERRRLLDQAGEQVFKDMYEELMLQSAADRLGVEVAEEQVDRAATQMREAYGLKTDEDFRAALAQSGLSEPKLREQLRANIRLREVLAREVNSKIKVEEDDLRRVYRKNIEQFRVPEQVELREIVVLAEAVPAAEERQRIAGEIARQVASGKKLEEVVESYRAQGQTSGVIDLGKVSPGDLDPSLESASWKLERGALSTPVEGRGGLHLLQMVERHPSYVRPFSEVSAQIQQREEERIYREKVVEYMGQLRQQSLVVANPPPDAAGYERLLGTAGKTTDEFNVGRATTSGPTGSTEPAVPSGQGAAPAPAAPAEGTAGTTAAPQTPEQAIEQPQPTMPEQPGEPGVLPEPKPVDPAPESQPAVPPPAQG
jgi:foldase protein PrsA